MKIFVTGITGFVGGSVANYFASLGHEITGIGRSGSLPVRVSRNCKYIQGDISQPLAEIEADAIIHAAGVASHTASFAELYAANVKGTQNVLDAAKKVKHIIHISSSSVYHFNEHAMKENEAGLQYKELCAYGKSKLLAEHCLLRSMGDKTITILRPRAIYGRHDQSLLPRLIKLVKGDKLVLPAHLSKQISLTHIDNLIQAIELCLENRATSHEVYNVADKEPYDLQQVLVILLPLVAGKRLKQITIPAWLFELFITINSRVKLNPSLNRFAADSLTKTALMNTDKITRQLKYNPQKNFYNSYSEIGNWIHQEEGWKTLFRTIPAKQTV